MNSSPDLSFKTFGTGNKHIIFLHGFSEVKEMWDDFIPTFSDLFEKYTFISIDLPGFGKSPLSDDTESLVEVANNISDFVRSININRAIWIGHSLGGYVLMNLIKNNSDLIEGLCFFHSSIYADSTEKKQQRDKAIDFIRNHGKEAFIQNFIPNLFYPKKTKKHQKEIKKSIEQALENTDESIIKYFQMMRDREDLSYLLQKVDFPIHFIAGKKDSAIPIEISKQQSECVINSSSLLIDGCGHMGMFEKPQECISSIRLFISSTLN